MTGPARRRFEFRSRREFLAAGLGAAVAGFGRLPPSALAQLPPASPELNRLEPGLAVVTGAGGNIVVVEGADSLVLVDTGSAVHAAAVGALLDEHFAGKPVRSIINTHWHTEHTGGNEVLGATADAIIAHENTRLWMNTTFYVDWEEQRYFPRSAAALPSSTFFSSDPQPRVLELDGERLFYARFEPAHTDGDVYVHLPERNLIVAGGTVSAGRYPVIDYITGGWIGGLADAMQVMMNIADERTRIVPDLGDPVGMAALQARHAMLTTVRERIEAIALEGRGVDDMIAAGITAEFDAQYGDPELFIRNAYHGMWWNRIRGIVA